MKAYPFEPQRELHGKDVSCWGVKVGLLSWAELSNGVLGLAHIEHTVSAVC